MFNRTLPWKYKTIYAELPVTTATGTTGAAMVIDTSGPVYGKVTCLSGVMYLSTLSTAPLTGTGIKMSTALNSSLEIYTHNGYVSLYSTSTGATREFIVYGN